MKIKYRFSFIFLMLILASLLINCSSTGQGREQYAYSSDPAILQKGNRLFDNNCVVCHNFQTTGIGPNLAGLTREVSEDWLKSFIKNPMEMIEAKDERSLNLFEEFKSYMPPFSHLAEKELNAILAYIHTKKAKAKTPDRDDWGKVLRNPIPEPIQPSGISLIIREYLQIPPSASEGQQARVNKIGAIKTGSKRLFAHDLRGKLYELTDKEARLFLDVSAEFEAFIHSPGHGSGLGSFAFHPEFESNGLFYTTHTESPENSPQADFSLPDSLAVKLHWVLTEWKQEKPLSLIFEGRHRELMRIDMMTQVHGVQEISFNPFAENGSDDYGMLYIGVGEGGMTERRQEKLLQDQSKIWGTILRINPIGNNSQNGKYGIPISNPFVRKKGAQAEIYALGFRNPHRFSWDQANGNQMLATCIGQHFVEELNLIVPGANYGWPKREGSFRIDAKGDLGKVYPLAEDEKDSGYTYPVAQFDHDEGLAICGGYVYRGRLMPALQGKYIFGEIVKGRIFILNSDELEMGKQAEIKSVSIIMEDGRPAKWEELSDNVNTGHGRIDFRMGIDGEGELYLSTKANGKIFKVIGMQSEPI